VHLHRAQHATPRAIERSTIADVPRPAEGPRDGNETAPACAERAGRADLFPDSAALAPTRITIAESLGYRGNTRASRRSSASEPTPDRAILPVCTFDAPSARNCSGAASSRLSAPGQFVS
jgi:hypothetical protein